MSDPALATPDARPRPGHLRSGRLMDLVPPGQGNTWQARFLKEHARIVAEYLEQTGVEISDLHRLMVVRLARLALQVHLFEQGYDQGRLTNRERDMYLSLQREHLGALRELVRLGTRRTLGTAAPDPIPDAPPSAACLRELLLGTGSG